MTGNTRREVEINLDSVVDTLKEVSRQFDTLCTRDEMHRELLQKCLDYLNSIEGQHILESLEDDAETVYADDLIVVDNGRLITDLTNILAEAKSTSTFFSYTRHKR